MCSHSRHRVAAPLTRCCSRPCSCLLQALPPSHLQVPALDGEVVKHVGGTQPAAHGVVIKAAPLGCERGQRGVDLGVALHRGGGGAASRGAGALGGAGCGGRLGLRGRRAAAGASRHGLDLGDGLAQWVRHHLAAALILQAHRQVVRGSQPVVVTELVQLAGGAALHVHAAQVPSRVQSVIHGVSQAHSDGVDRSDIGRCHVNHVLVAPLKRGVVVPAELKLRGGAALTLQHDQHAAVSAVAAHISGDHSELIVGVRQPGQL
mmetsp:Transcript_25836/g.56284  ORF Transcript_25836/g.56284 Transcript_25836/m.56284 type:complete len:262 (+) Transcript_25836:558-1343(+)